MSELIVSPSRDQLVGLAVEYWRLSSALGVNNSAPVNYALRKIGEFIQSCELEIRVLNGQPYDPGLSARVIETIDDRSLSGQAPVVVQTLSPMILHRGNVVRSAEIVISRNPD